MNVDVVYDEPGEEWITGFVMTPQGLQANILESHYDGERHASINVSYNGSEGSVTAVRSVLQVRPALEGELLRPARASCIGRYCQS